MLSPATGRPATSHALSVRVLGPVRIADRHGELTEPSGVRAKAFIAALALASGATVSVPQLIDDLWGEAPPRGAKAALQTLVSRLRQASADGLIASNANGYALADPDSVDLAVAGRLREAGRAAQADGDSTRTAALASQALSLWQGDAGADLGEGELAGALAARAASLRDDLVRLRASAWLQSGEAEKALADLDTLTGTFPYDEAVAAQRMRALAALGRLGEALQVFADMRARLADDLGSDPSAALVALNADLMRGDASGASAAGRRVRIGLRSAPNALLGRDGDIAALEALLDLSRLVTILGPGGLGKTRLAQEMGHRTAAAPAVVVVELAGVRSADDITLALASTLGIREVTSSRLTLTEPSARLDVRERILGVLRERATLLIVDNCEHVIDAAAGWIEEILAQAPNVRVLATSRAPLAIGGEQVYPLDSLASGRPGELGPAVTLFMERARAARPGAWLPADVIGRLCERLDGLPLAIELAAARIRSMPVDEIERRLGNRFALLTSGERTAPERHRTLLAVIDWSWNLLTEAERVLLRRLARFSDGFSADAAQRVGSVGGEDVTDALEGLIGQSLVQVAEEPLTGDLRYRMLETVREFGQMALVDAGEDASVDEAMLRWAEWFARATAAGLNSADQLRTFRAITLEQENLVSALRHALDTSRPDIVASLFATIGYYWSLRGAHSDAAGFGPSIVSALRRYMPDADHLDAVIASLAIAGTSSIFDNNRSALVAFGRLRRLKRQASSSDPVLDMLASITVTALSQPESFDVILQSYLESDDPRITALADLLMAQLMENNGQIERALKASMRSWQTSERNGNVWAASTAAQSMAELYSQSSRAHEALQWVETAERGMRELQASGDLDHLHWIVAVNRLAVGQIDTAERMFDGYIAGGEPTVDQAAPERLGIGRAGLAEVALARGSVAEGLKAYRRAAASFGSTPPPNAPWRIMVSASCLLAHVHAGKSALPEVRELARALRVEILVTARVRGRLADLPVTGSGLLGIAGWLLAHSAEHESAEHESAEIGMVPLRLFALAGALGSRQDFPSLRRERVRESALARFGADAVEAAEAAVRDLEPREAMEAAYAALTCRELRALVRGL
ncbi:BTAD domain-containing putative transcriptional regulator [Microbacterium sp. STN6]|uniref:BTAD domain-containing putative transcriptional regulator n=1 Tax=Microbacterium sp. STN6 TaxID=2995588 RepID=UPI002260C391|nr:BTAD domain-containing putative transcriptional regulator [Microbacterium sp. STN6]MCX7521774.1 BTAD domain-containing putative transcriptional regulator [Microbacterium sp. STN6]